RHLLPHGSGNGTAHQALADSREVWFRPRSYRPIQRNMGEPSLRLLCIGASLLAIGLGLPASSSATVTIGMPDVTGAPTSGFTCGGSTCLEWQGVAPTSPAGHL